ncbi:sugar ABC transporter permease [Arthrobacter sp. zg-Y1116]|nr:MULTISPECIES: multiple monosaccharide ABC transporter permease [unclassified Arthrobacter]MCQ1947546.1 sugar ABC transporter permease [Arthrobacter sp. zg-Y1116]MCQ1987498.1 sugar ABC transporter permease [Arthrobacter sp. zg-Y844]MCQ1996842.1 sugar ABC transporter permease [Arthrobacter sp. zg-Y1171]UWX83354.1 sugar ABC transporter permease [Arthrobacter sp. zg-Y1171]
MPPQAAAAKTRRRIDLRQYGILAALVVIILLFQVLTGGRLLYPGNVSNLIQQNAYVLILAIGMVMVIIAGHIDLSVGSVVAAVGAIAALAMNDWGMPWWAAVVLSLVAGALIGAWQGFWVAFVGIPAFIVTLAGMLVFRGVALVLLTGGTVSGLPRPFNAIGSGALPSTGTPDLLTLGIGALASIALVVQQLKGRADLRRLDLPRERTGSFVFKNAVAVFAIMYLCYLLAYSRGLPIILIILAGLVLAYSFLLGRTVFGRHIYAMGGNLNAAMMSGVKTQWVNFLVFVNMGFLAGLAAVVSTARAGGAVASAGGGFELDAIAAVFIGGASVQGGVGTVVGAVIGGLVMGVLNQGLSILSVDAAWQQIIKGLVLLAAVVFGLSRKRNAR